MLPRLERDAGKNRRVDTALDLLFWIKKCPFNNKKMLVTVLFDSFWG